jgi:hypothetical protein
VSDSTESVPSLPTAEEMGENSEGESEAIEVWMSMRTAVITSRPRRRRRNGRGIRIPLP